MKFVYPGAAPFASRLVILSVASLCLGAQLKAQQPTRSTTELPNVVMIMCDDLGYGDVGFNGNDIIQTPNLDQLAAGGLVFDRFYAGSPVCSPTRGSCLTGRHPLRYGIRGANSGHLPESEITIAEILKPKGYLTGHFGKWHLGTLTTDVVDSNRGGRKNSKQHYSPPWLHGFDTCFSTEAKVPTHDPMKRPFWSGKKWWDPVGNQGFLYGTRYWNEKGESIPDLEGSNSQLIVNEVIEFVDRANEESAPFFSVIWFHSPHLPVVAADKFTDPYQEYSKYQQHYFGCISAMDEQVGRLVDRLRSNGQLENTLIVFCSDNGPEGQKGRAPGSAGDLSGRKRSLREGGIRVPGFVYWPAQVESGQRTSFPAFTSDYLPTIRDIVRSDHRLPQLDGTSLVEVFANPNADRQQPIFFNHGRQRAAIFGDLKIYSNDQGESFSLFDLREDPSESRDLSESIADEKAKMIEQLAKWEKGL